MVQNTQNYWVFGLCPSSDILKNYKTQRFGNWICFRPEVRGETPTLSGPLERANLNHSPSHEDGNRYSFGHVAFSSF
jgi:hypothetical protein